MKGYDDLQKQYAPWLTARPKPKPLPPLPLPPIPRPLTMEERLVAAQLAEDPPLPPTILQRVWQLLSPIRPRLTAELGRHELEALTEIQRERELRFAAEKAFCYLEVRHRKLCLEVIQTMAKVQKQARVLAAYRKRWRLQKKLRGLPRNVFTKAVGE